MIKICIYTEKIDIIFNFKTKTIHEINRYLPKYIKKNLNLLLN